MHIALIGAEFEENLAIRYLWGALEKAGHSVTFIKFNAEDEIETVARTLKSSNTTIAGLSMVFTLRAKEFAAVATRAKQLGYQGHIIAGGHFAAFNAKQLLCDIPSIDSVGCGEGEEIMCALASSLDALASVKGLIWRNGNEIISNTPCVNPPDLDRLTYPIRKQPFDSYFNLPIANVLSSRGCSYSCAFCSISAWHKLCGGARVRYRTPENVAMEIAGLYKQGVRIFNFHDDNFIIDDKTKMNNRIDALESELSKNGVGKIAFAIKARPGSVNQALFNRLKSIGLFRVFLGIEAGTEQALRQLERCQTPTDNQRALAILNDLDLHTCFNLLLFNPYSTIQDISANINFLQNHPANPMNFCRTEIYEGTPLERKLRKENRLTGSYWGYDYTIANSDAQEAYEMIFKAFFQRNFGENSLHNLTMQVDYEHQILQHFFNSTYQLRQQVKQYVIDVNLNTCNHLKCIINSVMDGFRNGTGIAPYAQEITDAVAADDRRLIQNGEALLTKIHNISAKRIMISSKWLKGAAAASLAAALTIGNHAYCKENDSTPKLDKSKSNSNNENTTSTPRHFCEMVARPPRPPVDQSHPIMPKPVPLENDSLLIRKTVLENLAQLLHILQIPFDVVHVQIDVDSTGQIGGSLLTPQISDTKTKRLVQDCLTIRKLNGTSVTDTSYRMSFSKIEFTDYIQKFSQTHMAEMAPRPPYSKGEAAIFIVSIPPVADVYHNGKLIGRTNVSQLILPAGEQTLTFKKGGKSLTKEFTLKSGENPNQMVRIP
jgi:radical SAM superfamily enzyme YgiQ (UPF0313 family)